ncbi:hypothetical protein Cgig2_017102 [Carnegiea gigantea]|uniref:WAT1-related protein n=1 Tax=Carnegiea gigantea TaxID=171969 RepID=A0A9Q1JNE4_9CARY|nr:hypothetical protein Cgig2_017102 [Carnegiea gigantea]
MNVSSYFIENSKKLTIGLHPSLRMGKIDLRKSSSQAKCLGTIIAISGATVVTLYKGSSILALGGLLLVITAFLSAIGNILQALSTTVIRNTVITWCLRVRWPVYVATYKPLAIVIAMIMGLSFLGDNLYLGSVIGSIAIAAGFYAIIWGQAEEQDIASNIVHDPESTCEQNVPLLKTTDH